MLNFYRDQALLQRFLHNIIISTTLLGLPAQAKIKVSQQQRAATKVVEDYFIALNENDLHNLISLFHEHAVEMLDEQQELLGHKNIKLNFENLLQNIKHKAILKHSFTRINGNIAIVESETQMKLKILETGVEIPTLDKDLFILKRIDGDWKIDKHICNGNSCYLDDTQAIG